ncbi:MAG: hypothetical protein Kow0031_21250 [Anaerolineae bacterium]
MTFALLLCLAGLLATIFFIGAYASAWNKLNDDGARLTTSVTREAKRLAPGVVLWATFGSACGVVGVFIMTRVAGITMAEAGWWLWLGIGPGLIWGVIWGIIYGITERNP